MEKFWIFFTKSKSTCFPLLFTSILTFYLLVIIYTVLIYIIFLILLLYSDFDLNLKVLLGKDQQTIEITLQNTPNTNSPEFTKEEIYDQYMKDLFSENPVFGENDRDIKIFTASLKFMKHRYVFFIFLTL